LKIYHALKETSDLSDHSTLTVFAGIATNITIKANIPIPAKSQNLMGLTRLTGK
jgi:hypothetical protein